MFSSYLVIMLISGLIPVLVLTISTLFMENKVNETGESPFECGFEPISFSRVPFSMQFFSITIVFLIFDLEVVIILPLLMNDEHLYLSFFWIMVISFLLVVGLMVERYDGSLDWEL